MFNPASVTSRARPPRNFAPKPKHHKPPRVRPTHFLAIPLNTNAALRTRIVAFQDRLLWGSGPTRDKIRGLDKSIIIDPRRFHFTLGVMSLVGEEETDSVVAAPVAMSIETFSETDVRIAATSSPSASVTEATITTTATASIMTISPPSPPPEPRHTVSGALALLQSLKPQLDDILCDSSSANAPGTEPEVGGETGQLHVVLDRLDILKPTKPPRPKKRSKVSSTSDYNNQPNQLQSPDPTNGGNETPQNLLISDHRESENGPTDTVIAQQSSETHDKELWANVLHLAPREEGVQGQKLRRISDLVHNAFREAGYVTEARGLTLHCTVLNASKRKPSRFRGDPFCYSDLLRSDALSLLGASPAPPPTTNPLTQLPPSSSADSQLPPQRRRGHRSPSYTIPIDLDAPQTDSTSTLDPPSMSVHVKEIGLWIMGSYGENNEYISCGGVELGPSSGGGVATEMEVSATKMETSATEMETSTSMNVEAKRREDDGKDISALPMSEGS